MANPGKDDPINGDLPMRLGLGQITNPTEQRLRYIKQLGVEDVIFNTPAVFPAGKSSWDLEDPREGDSVPLSPSNDFWFENVVQLKSQIESHGMRLHAIANFPYSGYRDVMLGGENQEEQLNYLKNLVQKIGELNIPLLSYHWMPNGVWRTSTSYKLRGDAESTAFDLESVRGAPLTHGREYTEAEMWEFYERFVKEVVPVAEEAEVRLALHPDDPPVSESLGGVPRLFRNFENFKRALDIVPSEYHGLEFCLGNWSAMGVDLEKVIDYFGSRNKIFHVHFQTISGSASSFNEVFVDDNKGYYEPGSVMKYLKQSGFRGVIRPGHVPKLEGDTSDWRQRGRAYTIGYMRRLIDDLK